MLGLVLLLLGSALAGDPEVFGDYFDDEIRFVDIPQDVALTACLEKGSSTTKKVMEAYDGCFGEDYSFDDLAETDGPDKDNDDLQDKFEGNEACFYEKMNWVSKNLKEVDPAAIKADMEGLSNEVAEQFKANIDSCAAWSGNFGADRRSKREVEDVPSLMEAGSRALGWVKALVRKTRSAEQAKEDNNPLKGNSHNNGRKPNNGKKGPKNKNARKVPKNKKDRKVPKNKKDRKVPKNKKDRKVPKNKKDRNEGKGNGKGNGNKDKKNNKPKNGGKNGGKKELKEEIYNQLWCFDLALEQALEKCVENKIKN